MALLVFFNVSLHLFSQDLAWVTEFGELLMVWVTFLGGACAAQRGAHMTITEFIDKLTPARSAAGPTPRCRPLCLGMLLVLVRYRLVAGGRATGATSSPCWSGRWPSSTWAWRWAAR